MTRRDEGGGNEGECARGQRPAFLLAVRRPSPSVLPSFFFCAAACLHPNLIVARLLTSKFKEAKMTSSLSRFAMFFTPKKRKFMEIIMVPGGVHCLPFGLLISSTTWYFDPLLPGTLNVILTWYTNW